MGMPAIQDSVTTIDQLLALPEDGMRHELLAGVHVVTPAPLLAHQWVVTQLILLIGRELERRDDLAVFTSPADIVLGPRTLVQPDVFVVRKPPGTRLKKWADVGVPVLAVEVLSPATAPRDRGAKRLIYQQAGVGEYWIVDLEARLIERWRPADERPEVLRGQLKWEFDPAVGQLEIDLPTFFAGALGAE